MTAKREYTKHQQKIISNYYKTADARAVDALQQIATELYLASTEKKRTQLWQRARKALETLEVKPTMIDHIVSSGKPEILAEHNKDML